MKIKPVILAGGFGVRLWPISKRSLPKQFIKIFHDLSLLQQTLIRNIVFGKPTIVITEQHQAITKQQIAEIAIDVDLIIEPTAKNTAPAALLAALSAESALYDFIILIPSDHYILGENEYILTVLKAIECAIAYGVCMIGLKVNRPSSDYGYIKTNSGTSIDNIFKVERFIEKPEYTKALTYFVMSSLGYANYFWNSGIFVFNTKLLINKARIYQPKLLERIIAAFTHSANSKESIKLNADSYAQITSISIDHAIMEHIDCAYMVQGDFLWADLGSWGSLWNARTKDKANNYFEGNVFAKSVTNSYVSTENKLTAVVGLDNVIVVNTDDALLVANKATSEDINALIKYLASINQKEL